MLRFTSTSTSSDERQRTWTIDMTRPDFSVEMFMYSKDRTAIVISAHCARTTRLQSQTLSFSTSCVHRYFIDYVGKYARTSTASLSFQTKRYVPPTHAPVSAQTKRLTAAAAEVGHSAPNAETPAVSRNTPSVLQLLAQPARA
jgi:hypothetical protein